MDRYRMTALLLALAAALAAGRSQAEERAQGVYGGIAGGVNWQHDQPLEPDRGTVGFDTGWLGAASVGYAFANGVRPELEFSYRRNDVGSAAAGAPSGSEHVIAGMANLWYDFPSAPWLPWLRPFVGIGVGSADVTLDQVADAAAALHDDTANVLAYQGGAGVAFDVTPQLALSLGYRYFQTDKGKFDPGVAFADYKSDAVLAGLRFIFGRATETTAASAAEPAAAPGPGEAAAFETVVLRPVNFQFNRADLTDPARETLDRLAQRMAAEPKLTVLIEGYADAVGSAQYNQRLGERRAEAVREYLAGKGIDRARMDVASWGEQNPVADNATPEGRARNRRAAVWPDDEPQSVRIRIAPPTPDSVDAAHGGDPAEKADGGPGR